MIKVRLQKLAGQKRSSVEVDPRATLGDLRQAICDSNPLSSLFSWSVVVGQRMLPQNLDTMSLADLGIDDGATLSLIKQKVVFVATASRDETAKIWDTSTGECTQNLHGHDGAVESAVFSGDGASVLTASRDTTAKIWDIFTGECTQTFSGHSGDVYCAMFSGDGSSVLTASDDNTAKIWSHLHWGVHADIIWAF